MQYVNLLLEVPLGPLRCSQLSLDLFIYLLHGMDMLHSCFQSWITFWWCQDLPITLMIIARKEPKTILLHGLKTTTMVVDVSILRCIFHAIQCISLSGSGTVDSLHLMCILYVIPGGDNQLYCNTLKFEFFLK